MTGSSNGDVSRIRHIYNRTLGRAPAPVVWAIALFILLTMSFILGRRSVLPTRVVERDNAVPGAVQPGDDMNPTMLYAHNVLLRKGAHFRVYVRWIRGQLLRTKAGQNPSLDVPNSFVFEIQKGVINVKFSDIADFLNNGDTPGKPPLKDISIENKDGQLQIHGTAHKLIPLPVRLDGVVTPLPDGRLKFHLVKLNVLKVPMKGLLGAFHIELSDLVKDPGTAGIQIVDNDVYADTQKILPPPHIHGNITSVVVESDQLKIIYGGETRDEQTLAQWHNFLRLSGGNLDFGKLTMRQVDLTMIDASDDPWFDLDLVNYQAQLVYGTTRMTSKAGVEIYMPDIEHMPKKVSTQGVGVEWLKNRSTAPPLDVPKAK